MAKYTGKKWNVCIAHNEVANKMSGTIPMNLGMAMEPFQIFIYKFIGMCRL